MTKFSKSNSKRDNDPTWLQPYCSWCRIKCENMNEYLQHLRSRWHETYVTFSKYDRRSISPLGWRMPNIGELVHIWSGSYRNRSGEIMRIDKRRSVVDVFMYSLLDEEVFANDIPLYAVVLKNV